MRRATRRRDRDGMNQQLTSTQAPNADEPHSTADKLEHDAVVAGAVGAGGLRGVEVAAVVLIGLLVCPPLAILVVVVVVPLLIVALVVGLLIAVITTPYLLVHHF